MKEKVTTRIRRTRKRQEEGWGGKGEREAGTCCPTCIVGLGAPDSTYSQRQAEHW